MTKFCDAEWGDSTQTKTSRYRVRSRNRSFIAINSSRLRVRTVAHRHRLAAYHNKHCWQAFCMWVPTSVTLNDRKHQRQQIFARVVSNCGNYDRGLTHFRRRVLHWLDVTDRIRLSAQRGSWIFDRSLPASRQHWRPQASAICKPWSTAGFTDQNGNLRKPCFWTCRTTNALPNTIKCSWRVYYTFRRNL